MKLNSRLAWVLNSSIIRHSIEKIRVKTESKSRNDLLKVKQRSNYHTYNPYLSVNKIHFSTQSLSGLEAQKHTQNNQSKTEIVIHSTSLQNDNFSTIKENTKTILNNSKYSQEGRGLKGFRIYSNQALHSIDFCFSCIYIYI